MPKLFDLFKIGNDGKPLWLGSVESIEDARIKAKVHLASDLNCDFCVLDQNTGKRINIPGKELV